MKEVDFLVIGQGLVGSTIAFELLSRAKKVEIIDLGSGQVCSRKATGLINPITGRRFVKSWLTDQILNYAQEYYPKLEKELNASFYSETKVVKVLQSIEQQNDFFARLNDEAYQKYLESDNIISTDGSFKNPLGVVGIRPVLFIDVLSLMDSFLKYFKALGIYKNHQFNYDELKISDSCVEYNEIRAKQIIFSEGYLLRNNPFFNYLPIQFAKGEVLIIKALELKLDSILNAQVNLTPLGEDRYFVGSTYDWSDMELNPTEAKKQYLIQALENVIRVDYEIEEHWVGMRPTVKDRRPLIGQHPDFKNLFVFNGMGTKGLSLAPYFANEFTEHLLFNKALHPEASINRFQ